MNTLSKTSKFSVALLTLAVASTVQAGTSADSLGYLATISLSGATALRAFTTNPGSTYLESGVPSLTLSNGTYAPGTGQLAPSTYSSSSNPILATGPQSAPDQGEGARIEYHEQGAIEGILELAHDQINPTIVTEGSRNPTVNNPIWINGNKITALGSGNTTTVNGYTLAPFNLSAQPVNTPGVAPSTAYQGQNTVQAAVDNGNATEGFSFTGTSSVHATPASAGYGKGNPALPVGVIGASNASFQLQDQSVLNNSSLGLTSGVNNLTSTYVAQGASILGANPGTGLTRVNKTDAQWLQTTSRLQNGAEFNVITGDINNGTRNVVANDTGVDPSYAVGKNDNGNGDLGTDQNSIGSALKYSGKTSIGTQLRPTVENLRSAVGILGYGDATSGNAITSLNTAVPIRALDYADSYTDPTNDPNNPVLDATNNYLALPGQWARVSLKNIVTGAYAIGQFESYVTVNDPTRPGDILGDPGNDVKNYIQFVKNSAANVPLGSILGPGDTLIKAGFVPLQGSLVTRTYDGQTYTYNGTGPTAADPTLIYGGAGFTPDNPASDSLLGDATVPTFFSVVDPNTQTKGNSSAIYGGAGTNTTAFNTTIKITDPDAGNTDPTFVHQKGNWLLGNFNQNGSRDFSSVETGLYALQALVASGDGLSSFTADGGASNSAAVSFNTTLHPQLAGLAAEVAQTTGTTGANKGDLIVLGDFNGDGLFNGTDLYDFAHGAAISDASGAGYTNGQLTTASGVDFGDQVRAGISRKNEALDFLQANTTAGDPIRVSASQNLTNDPTGINAFNKLDVNHDGLVNIQDAAIVNKFVGQNYTNLNDQLAATINLDGTAITTPATAQPFNLLDAKLLDTATGVYVDHGNGSQDDGATITEADFGVISSALVSAGKLFLGDSNFDGVVDIKDLTTVANHWQQAVSNWSLGDFNGDGVVDINDLTAIANNWQDGVVGGSGGSFDQALADVGGFTSSSAVPEPTSLTLLALGSLFLAPRRRRGV